VDQSLTGSRRKLTLDEESFEELLAAAYVVQEHTDRLHVTAQGSDSGQALAEIVETRRLLQSECLNFEAAAELIAKRTQRIIKASAVTVGVLKEGKLCYQAAAGNVVVQGSEPVPPDSYLNRGEPLECSDTTKSRERFLQIAAEKGIKALLVIPLYRDRRFLGFLELQFEKSDSFHDGDIRAAQLLASLLVEAFDFNRKTSPYSLSEEHEKMLKLLEELRPELERLQGEVESPRTAQSEQSQPAQQVMRAVSPSAAGKDAGISENMITCRRCGNVLVAGELFCGICGTARPEKPAHENSQYKPDSLSPRQPTPETTHSVREDQVQPESLPAKTRPSSPSSFEQFLSEVAANTQPEPSLHPNSKSISDFGHFDSQRIDAEPAFEPDSTAQDDAELFEPERQEVEEDASLGEIEPASSATESVLQKLAEPTSTALVPLRIIPTEALPTSEGVQLAPWKSAGRARQWLKLAGTAEASRKEWAQKLWKRHRANIWVAVSACILLAVILTWSTQSPVSSSPSSAKSHGRRPAPNLTLFEKLLVTLGLAVPPEMPAFSGNPDSKVWVDVHTALYYCPGADLYGKTPGGRITTQKDAQQDQFEPARRKACE
jgi:hypothetical protein